MMGASLMCPTPLSDDESTIQQESNHFEESFHVADSFETWFCKYFRNKKEYLVFLNKQDEK